jgi:hypothetical protein
MSKNYVQAKNVCVTILSGSTERVSIALIRDTIGKVMLLYALLPEEQEQLFGELETLYAVFSDQHRILDDARPIPWIKNAKADYKWDFWNRYRKLLETKGFAPDTVNKLDDLTDDLLDRLVKPGGHHSFDKRGLIVGQVQSGKTANYIGLICKAADVGYKFIIVLAGIHKTLRAQTQLRIDEGFLGFDTVQERNFARASNRIGVGKFNPRVAVHSLTTSGINGDFNRRASESSGISIGGNDPIILVIKKNASVMRNLLGWLASRGETMPDGNKQIRNLPLLLIDDEADNASINISKNQVSAINACIRALLKLFDQSVYMGYTATPYANIFIPPYLKEDSKGLEYNMNNLTLPVGEDIFPRNFIVNIPAPSNYIGPEKIFGIVSSEHIEKDVDPLPLLRIIDDYIPQPSAADETPQYKSLMNSIEDSNRAYIPDGHKEKDSPPGELPGSLRYAIKCFFLVCAARRARGQVTEHNSMLVHVSRYVKWQEQIATLVLNEVKACALQIEFNQQEFIRELEIIWIKEFVPVTREVRENPMVKDPGITPLPWQVLLEHLYPASAKIEVRAVHGDTRIEKLSFKNIRPLDYYDNQAAGLSVIAVGGDKLSRGLTLEGLSISYFLRSAKMYDTLMQMGRWFGYRQSYLDLCRLFTSAEISEWYRHITVATEEMRAEFDRMGDLDKAPKDYGLKVRTHPGALAITATNKFRYKKIMRLSYSRVLEETYSFRKHSRWNQENYNLTLRFLNELGMPGVSPNSDSYFKNHYVWQGIGNAEQLTTYLSAYRTDQPSFYIKLMCEYILAQKQDDLKNWTIALINSSRGKPIKINELLEPGMTRRSDSSNDDPNYYVVAKSHIIDPWHEYIDLTDAQIEKARNESKADSREKGRDPEKLRYPSTMRIRMNRPRTNGLLLIYVLDPKPDEDKPAVADFPIIALALSFPDLTKDGEKDREVEYAVNEIFEKQLNYPDELDEEEEDQETAEIVAESEEEKLEAVKTEMEEGRLVNMHVMTEFIPGRRIHFSTGAPTNPPDGAMLVALPANYGAPYTVPLIRAEDIAKYLTPEFPDFKVKTAVRPPVGQGELLIAPVVIKSACFTLSDDNFQIDDSCIAMRITEPPAGSEAPAPEYALALLNSVLFTFWINITDSYGQDVEEVVKTFPLKSPGHDVSGIIVLVRAILYLQKNRFSRDSQVMAGYFVSIIDAAALEIYFPGEFIENGLSVLGELTRSGITDIPEVTAAELYRILNNPDHPIKKAVFSLTTIRKFQLIFNNLTPRTPDEDQKDYH